MPTYGVVGSQAYSYNVTTYTRNVAVDIVTAGSLKDGSPSKIYESRAVSKGSCSQMPEVIDEILEAIFKEFPGESGRSRKVIIPGKFDC